MADQWNPEEKVVLDDTNIQRYKEQIAKNVALPADAQEWVNALRGMDLVAIRKLLKAERKNLPTKHKRLYRDTDQQLLRAVHAMRTQSPFFTDREKTTSRRYLSAEQSKEDGVTHPLMSKKPF